ncbi:MAG TPA: cyclopropane-fatty-acyl-phospholipid synthase family protein [Drouetiella sp.]|jgi:cyclopropane-fatty-acyl-phospholipid synthase
MTAQKIELEKPQAPVREKKQSQFQRICQNLVLSQLKKMTRGHLSITLPDTQILELGKPGQFPSAAMEIISSAFFEKCVLFGAIGFAEAYIDSLWNTSDLTAVIAWFIENGEDSTVFETSSQKSNLLNILNFYNRLVHRSRSNTLSGSKENIHDHYDLGNDFFKLFLDDTMTYSSAMFEYAKQPLEAAQIKKYDELCKKMRLRPEDQVLEIGSGWGYFALHAATNYGCKVTTITLSEEQFRHVTALVKEKNLTEQISVQLKDFRLMEGKFDKIVSIEMVEALGDQFIDTFFLKCSQMLTANGLLGIQMICSADCRYNQMKDGVDFIQKHIFPGGQLLSVARTVTATRNTSNLQLYHLQDFAESYAHTLAIWRDKFNTRLDDVRALGFSQKFIRKWNYYFSYCEAAFKTRECSVVQAIYTRPNNHMLAEDLAL